MRTQSWTGSVIGGYRLGEKIGSGGTSVVYRAESVRLGRTAAVKLLGPGFGDADFTERFVLESRLASSLHHPNIVPVFDAGEDAGALFLAMAYVEGTDLRALVQEEGPLSLRRTLRISSGIADALDAAHAHGLVHRDVKPANILVTPDDHAFLTDFGAVKEVSAPPLTRSGGFLGTIGYAAPEQIEGGEVDERTDVYGLTCVIWECLTATAPFRRASEVATLYAHLHDAPPRLRAARPELSSALENVLWRGLAKEPADRFTSCGELVAAARRATRSARIDGRRLIVASAVVAVAALAGTALGIGIGRELEGTKTSVVTRTASAGYAGRDLDAAAYALIQDGHYATALPFARGAVRALAGRGPADPYEGYANFNLGNILVELDRCREAIRPLERARRLQPRSAAAKALLARARRC